MFHRVVSFIFLITLSLLSSLYAQDEVDNKLLSNLKGSQLSMVDIISGLSQYLKNNYPVCSSKDVFMVRNDEGGDPDNSGCYIIYGPDDYKKLSMWEVQALIADKGNISSFTYNFDFVGNQFALNNFKYANMDMTQEKAKQMFQEILKLAYQKKKTSQNTNQQSFEVQPAQNNESGMFEGILREPIHTPLYKGVNIL